MLFGQVAQNLREKFRRERLIAARKHYSIHGRPDIVEKFFELFTGELAGGPLENGVVTEMAHHATQIAFVNDVEPQSQSAARMERPAKARLEDFRTLKMVRQCSVSLSRKHCLASELKRLDISRIEIDLDPMPLQ